MEIQNKISEYLEALTAQRTAKNTIEAYRRDLKQMADAFLEEQISEISKIGRAHV